jgi:hypothetical protein
MQRPVVLGIALLGAAARVSAAIDIDVEISHTNGTAPLLVFLDATATRGLAPTAAMPSGDFVNASFRWEFDTTDTDPEGKHETVFGFVAGHVFEAPGTYTVQLEVIDATGMLATTTFPITATAFSGTTYYVASHGSDTNAGTITAPWGSADYALGQVAPNTRILFRNGDTFPFDDVTYTAVTGPVIISQYSDPGQPSTNQPILHLQTNRDAIQFGAGACGFRVLDVHIQGTGGTVRGQGGGGPSFGTGSSHNLLLRVEVSDVGKDAFGTGRADVSGIVDCYGHDYIAYGIFAGSGRRLVFMGTTMRNQIGDSNEHVVRIAGGEKHYICYNDFSETIINSKTAVQIRGQQPSPSTNRHAIVSFNTVDRIIGFNPQNSVQTEYIFECLCEGNLILRNRDYTVYGGEVGINTAARCVAIRNNIIVDYLRPINIGGHVLVGPSRDISVYHNTIIRPGGEHGRLLQITSGVTNLAGRNNVYLGSATSHAHNDNVLDVGADSLVATSHNIYYCPGYTPTWEIVHTGAGYFTLTQAQAQLGYELNTLTSAPLLADTTNPLDAAFATLCSNSPARDSGAVVPVWYDRAGVPRPLGGAPDRGAYEFVPEPMAALAIAIAAAAVVRARGSGFRSRQCGRGFHAPKPL